MFGHSTCTCRTELYNLPSLDYQTCFIVLNLNCYYYYSYSTSCCYAIITLTVLILLVLLLPACLLPIMIDCLLFLFKYSITYCLFVLNVKLRYQWCTRRVSLCVMLLWYVFIEHICWCWRQCSPSPSWTHSGPSWSHWRKKSTDYFRSWRRWTSVT